MNTTQSLALTRFVKAACPQQKFDEYTPDAWHELLADLDFDDARAAATELAKAQPFVSPAEIRKGVRRIRAKRLEVDFEDIPALDAVADDPIAYQRVLRQYRAKVAAGWVPPEIDRPQVRASEVRALVERTADALPAMPEAAS